VFFLFVDIAAISRTLFCRSPFTRCFISYGDLSFTCSEDHPFASSSWNPVPVSPLAARPARISGQPKAPPPRGGL